MKFADLTKKNLEDYKQTLSDKRTRLERQLEEIKAEDPFANPDRLNDNAALDVEAAEQFGHERSQAMVEEISRSLKAIDTALLKIRKGTYGICEGCGRGIESARLEIDPAVQLCITCQKKNVGDDS